MQEKNHADPGKKKRKTTGLQSELRSTKESLPNTSGTSLRPTKRQKKQFDRNDPANICGVGEGNYYDDTDLQDAEGWIQCPFCQMWFHKTGAGVRFHMFRLRMNINFNIELSLLRKTRFDSIFLSLFCM